MKTKFMQMVEDAHLKTDVPDFRIGDRIEIHQKILDGAKERVQIFEGDVIARQNGGVRETVTVRRLVQGEGVERIFPIHSPRIAKIVVKKAGLGPPGEALLPPRPRRQGDQDPGRREAADQDRRRPEGGGRGRGEGRAGGRREGHRRGRREQVGQEEAQNAQGSRGRAKKK